MLSSFGQEGQKMAHFHGGIFLPLFFSLFFFLGSSARTADEQSYQDLSLVFSREELVQAAGYGEEKLSSVLVTGTVLCDACFDGEDELRSSPVEGQGMLETVIIFVIWARAVVGITCKYRRGKARKKWKNRAKGITDEYGDFVIHLPSHLHANPKLDKVCTVRVLRLPKNCPCQWALVRK